MTPPMRAKRMIPPWFSLEAADLGRSLREICMYPAIISCSTESSSHVSVTPSTSGLCSATCAASKARFSALITDRMLTKSTVKPRSLKIAGKSAGGRGEFGPPSSAAGSDLEKLARARLRRCIASVDRRPRRTARGPKHAGSGPGGRVVTAWRSAATACW